MQFPQHYTFKFTVKTNFYGPVTVTKVKIGCFFALYR